MRPIVRAVFAIGVVVSIGIRLPAENPPDLSEYKTVATAITATPPAG